MSSTVSYGQALRHDRRVLQNALAGASTKAFWLDDPSRPSPRDRLARDTTADLVIVGGGFCGLWTALMAKERDPDRRVVLLEGERIGWAASGRNGGFVEASLTHGTSNGELHFPAELNLIEQFATENFEAFEATLRRYEIDAEWERTGMLSVATEPYQTEQLRADAAQDALFLTGDALAAYGRSPLYLAGLFGTKGVAYVNPAKLAWGLAATAEKLGVEIFEHTPARALRILDGQVRLETPSGIVRARKAALATNAFPSLLPGMSLFTAPIYDYVLMTEPLTSSQLNSISWTRRHGITDSSRQFHYYRKSADNRILFGGYDAIYHRGRRVRREYDQRPESFERLASHFFLTFPQLEGITFTHKWGGAIDMSTQLVAFHGTAKRGLVAYSAGYTGLGVSATRFGADVMLDLLGGSETERTRLKMSRRLPIPIPPEPLAYPLIQAMRSAVIRSDEREGKDGMLLRLARAFGVGFDS